MNRILGLITLALLGSLASAGRSGGSVSVRGYYRSDGTYVAPYIRSAPGGSGSSSSASTSTVPAPPPPTAPPDTYTGWTPLPATWADEALSSVRGGVLLTPGYSYRQVASSPTALNTLVQQVLTREAPEGSVFFTQHAFSPAQGDVLLVLVFRAEENRGLLLRAARTSAVNSVQVLGFTFDSAALDLSGYAESSRAEVRATLDQPAIASADTMRAGLIGQAPTTPLQQNASPAPAVSTPATLTPTVPTATETGAAGMTLADNMFVDPQTGAVVVAATCQPFSLTFRPATPFNRVMLTVKANAPVNYSLDVLAGDKLRFTQPDDVRSADTPQEIPVGAQAAGTPITLRFRNPLSVLCQGTLTLTLGAK